MQRSSTLHNSARNLNAGPYAHMECALLTESSPWPPIFTILIPVQHYITAV